MQPRHTKQRVLFVGLMFTVVLSARLLVITRAGAFLLATVIVISGLCIGFRMVERLVSTMWKVAGLMTAKFFSKSEEAAAIDPRLGSE